MAAWGMIVWIAVVFSLGVLPIASVASVCGDGVVDSEAHYISTHEYVVGVCTDVPGFIASPFVTCVTAPDGLGFIASTAHAQARQACDWRSVPRPEPIP